MIDILTTLAILIGSLVVLSKSSHVVVKSAVGISEMTGIHRLTIGFILLSVSTSLPELAVSVNSSILAVPEIAVGNVFGSNVANICLIIGIAAIMRQIILRHELEEVLIVLFLTSVIPLLLILFGELGQLIGVLLVGVFAFFVWYCYKLRIAIKERVRIRPDIRRLSVNFVYLFIGLVFVIVSARLVVSSSVTLADILGLTLSFIGATIVAVGTSLPELAVDLTAVRRGHIDLALGNVIGSCMVNMTLVLGLALALSPFRIVIGIFQTLIIFTLLSNLILWWFFERGRIDLTGGLILLTLYWLFLISLLGVQIRLPL